MDSAELHIAMEHHRQQNSVNNSQANTTEMKSDRDPTDQIKKRGQADPEVRSENSKSGSEQNNGNKMEPLKEEEAIVSDQNLSEAIDTPKELPTSSTSNVTDEASKCESNAKDCVKGDDEDEEEEEEEEEEEDEDDEEEEDSEVQEEKSFSSDHKLYKRSRNKSNDTYGSVVLDENGRCKPKDNDDFPTDFKLKVLHWAYCKSIHSAGHHFRLQRYIVRSWMLNEEKIYKSATEKGKRKWRRFDERVMRHLCTSRPVYGKPTETRLIRGLDELTF